MVGLVDGTYVRKFIMLKFHQPQRLHDGWFTWEGVAVVGEELVFFDGCAVGLELGFFDGCAVGLELGFLDGCAVGLMLDGAAEGE